MAQLLVQVVNVNALAGGGTITVAHSLESNGVAVAPTLVFADRPTPLRIVSVSVAGVTISNPSPFPQTANFRLERGWQPEVDASTVTTMLYQGQLQTGMTQRVAARVTPVTGFGASTNVQTFFPTSAAIPANTLAAASTIQFRVSGTSFNATGAGLNTTIEFFADADGAPPGTGLLASTGVIANIPNAAPFFLTANATIKAAGANVGTLGGVGGTFGAGAGGLNVAGTTDTANGVNTTAASSLVMALTFGTSNAGNSLTVNDFEIYLTA